MRFEFQTVRPDGQAKAPLCPPNLYHVVVAHVFCDLLYAKMGESRILQNGPGVTACSFTRDRYGHEQQGNQDRQGGELLQRKPVFVQRMHDKEHQQAKQETGGRAVDHKRPCSTRVSISGGTTMFSIPASGEWACHVLQNAHASLYVEWRTIHFVVYAHMRCEGYPDRLAAHQVER